MLLFKISMVELVDTVEMICRILIAFMERVERLKQQEEERLAREMVAVYWRVDWRTPKKWHRSHWKTRGNPIGAEPD